MAIRVTEELLLDYMGLLLMERLRLPDNDEGDFMKRQIDGKMVHIRQILEDAENESRIHAQHQF